MHPQIVTSSEQYWRDRYGMPAKSGIHGSRRAAPAWKRSGPERSAGLVKRLKTAVARSLDLRTKAIRSWIGSVRGLLLKVSAAAFLAIWIAAGGMVWLQAAPVGAPLNTIYPDFPQMPFPNKDASRAPSSPGFDGLMANFSATNEAGLVGLRGYLLTGSDGFKTEWTEAMGRLDAAQIAIEVDSRDWTDGQKLLTLRDMRKQMTALRNEEAVLIEIAGTANRYPGLRLYREDTDTTFVTALALLDDMLRSVLASNWPGAATRIDTLAHVRTDIRDMRASLASYLPSGASVPPSELREQYAAFRNAPTALSALRSQVQPEDAERVEKLIALLNQADAQLAQILALKQTPQWDYADYAFKQKVLPLAEKISAIITAWRAAG